MILAQTIPVPDEATNPWSWIALVLVIGLGALFLRYDSGKDGRITSAEKREADTLDRADKREQALLEDNKAQATVLQQQSSTLMSIAGLAESAVDMAKQGNAKIDVANQKIDGLQSTVSELNKTIDIINGGSQKIEEMRRTIEDLRYLLESSSPPPNPPSRRRTTQGG